MKKYVSLLILTLALVACQPTPGHSQSTTPRTGNSASVDNTYRKLNYKFYAPTEAAGLDTIKVNTNAFHSQYFISSLTDSVAFNVTSVANAYMGDELSIIVTNSSGSNHAVKWAGSYIQSATTTTGGAVGTAYLTSAKRAVIDFVFNGTVWVERSRMIQ